MAPAGYLEHFRARALQDALTDALPATWRRRAADFDAVGTQQCSDVALACRRHADLLERSGLTSELLTELVALTDDVWKEAG